MIDDPINYPTGVPLPLFAADSVLHQLHFVAVGVVPSVDTVVLKLKVVGAPSAALAATNRE